MQLLSCHAVPQDELAEVAVSGASADFVIPPEGVQQFTSLGNIQAKGVPGLIILMRQKDPNTFSYIMAYVSQDTDAYRLVFALSVGDRSKVRNPNDSGLRRLLRVQILNALRDYGPTYGLPS
jgi:hypothetical protein